MTSSNNSSRPRIFSVNDMPKGYKTDLHCHTKEGSYCSEESTADTIERYIAEGYSTVVIANHCTPDYYPKEYHWFIDCHFDVYDLAVETARGRINVLSGTEIQINQYKNDDFLVLGSSREVMHKFDNIFTTDLATVKKVLNENNCLLIKAHPMRYGQTMMPPNDVDGYELYNGHKGWARLNEIARHWVEAEGAIAKIKTAGSDNHNPGVNLKYGILTDEEIKTNEQLIRILKNRQYDIFHL